MQAEVSSPSRAEAWNFLDRLLADGAGHQVSLPLADQANLPLVDEALCLINDGPHSDVTAGAQLAGIADRAKASGLARGPAGPDGCPPEAGLTAVVDAIPANAHG